MNQPWNNWYHWNGNTYGTWPRGDPRGFRERRHRRHVDGDYKNPPAPGTHSGLFRRSQRLMTSPAVHLNPEQSTIGAMAMVDKLVRDGIEVIAVSLDSHHYHILARFPDRRPKHWIGRAKMHASMLLSQHGLPGRVWARGLRALPIVDRSHQLNAFEYIIGHRAQGAAVWTFRDPVPQETALKTPGRPARGFDERRTPR